MVPNRGKPWSMVLVEPLRAAYVTDELSVMELADMFDRSAGGITTRLKILGLATKEDDARWFSECGIMARGPDNEELYDLIAAMRVDFDAKLSDLDAKMDRIMAKME